jgi:hypothetical protein
MNLLKFKFIVCLMAVTFLPTYLYAQAGLESALGAATGANSKQLDKSDSAGSQPQAQYSGPPGTYEEFIFYDKQCKAQFELACLKAAKIMMSQSPPQQIYDLSSSRRAERTLRLYEIAINKGNLEAMEYAYDLYYDPYPLQRLINSYTDTSRARELMEIMIEKKYPGGLARQAKDYIESPEYALSLEKKSQGCKTVKALSSSSNLTQPTKEIVDNLNSSLVCKAFR